MSEWWDKIKQPTVRVVPVSEGGKMGKVFEEIMPEKFPNLVKQ